MLGAEERRLRLYIAIRRKEERTKATLQMMPLWWIRGKVRFDNRACRTISFRLIN